MTGVNAVRPAAVDVHGWGYRHAGRAREAVTGLDLHLDPGERVMLLGPSGAGKSTLLHGLAGVLGDDEDAAEDGRLLIDGQPAAGQRGRAGLLQQDPDTQVVLSRIGDDVAFGAENLAVPRERIWPRVREALDDVGLHLPLNHPTSALSGGQKQRLGLAGLLAMSPGLVLLDEPTANLDPHGVSAVRDAVVRSLGRTAATLVVVEHRVDVWADAIDRVVVLDPDGGLLADGPPAEVFARQSATLRAAGIWLPGRTVGVPRRPRDGQAGPTLLTAENVGVSRHRGRRRHPARPVASGIDARVEAGSALSITGPNGAGKSTFALTLAGLLPPVSGRVHAREALAAGAGPDPYAWTSRQLIGRIGTVFQEPEHQFVTTRVADELAFGPRQATAGSRTDAQVPDRTDELLERLRLTTLADANPFTLSGGEKRRLSVATVLAASPAVLVLDEPTFGQDANTWTELAELLISLLNEGTALVSVTHDDQFTDALGGARLRLGEDARDGARRREGVS